MDKWEPSGSWAQRPICRSGKARQIAPARERVTRPVGLGRSALSPGRWLIDAGAMMRWPVLLIVAVALGACSSATTSTPATTTPPAATATTLVGAATSEAGGEASPGDVTACRQRDAALGAAAEVTHGWLSSSDDGGSFNLRVDPDDLAMVSPDLESAAAQAAQSADDAELIALTGDLTDAVSSDAVRAAIADPDAPTFPEVVFEMLDAGDQAAVALLNRCESLGVDVTPTFLKP